LPIASSLFSAAAQVAPPADTNVEIELSVWKWVIIVGVAAIIIIYAIKRISEVVVKKKTDTMIRRVVGQAPSEEDEAGWEEVKKLDDESDKPD
jgi:hypothetical protein